jgi:hypothetical protein
MINNNNNNHNHININPNNLFTNIVSSEKILEDQVSINIAHSPITQNVLGFSPPRVNHT